MKSTIDSSLEEQINKLREIPVPKRPYGGQRKRY
jgi:hypothetical protein